MRNASETQFPYGYPGLICYMEQSREEPVQIIQCSTRGELRAAVNRSLGGKSRLLAVWPGKWKSDLFLIDDLDALAAKVF